MPDKPNPFSDAAANPYLSPTFEAYSGPLVPLTREQVRIRLLGPAIGLGISAAFWLMYVALVGVVSFIDSTRISGARPDMDLAQIVGTIVGMLLGLVLFSVPAVLMLVGAVQMLRVRSYRWCWVSVITGVLPCTFCLPLSLPFGIWGMVMLYDARVKLAFISGIKSLRNVSS